MFFLSVHQDETIFCYITAAFKKARLSVGKGRPWLFFPCFIRQVSPLPGDTVIGSGQPTRPNCGSGACSDRETPIPRRQRCTLIVAGDVGASAID